MKENQREESMKRAARVCKALSKLIEEVGEAEPEIGMAIAGRTPDEQEDLIFYASDMISSFALMITNIIQSNVRERQKKSA